MGDVFTAVFYMGLLAVMMLSLFVLSMLPERFPKIGKMADKILDHVRINDVEAEDDEEE